MFQNFGMSCVVFTVTAVYVHFGPTHLTSAIEHWRTLLSGRARKLEIIGYNEPSLLLECRTAAIILDGESKLTTPWPTMFTSFNVLLLLGCLALCRQDRVMYEATALPLCMPPARRLCSNDDVTPTSPLDFSMKTDTSDFRLFDWLRTEDSRWR